VQQVKTDSRAPLDRPGTIQIGMELLISPFIFTGNPSTLTRTLARCFVSSHQCISPFGWQSEDWMAKASCGQTGRVWRQTVKERANTYSDPVLVAQQPQKIEAGQHMTYTAVIMVSFSSTLLNRIASNCKMLHTADTTNATNPKGLFSVVSNAAILQ
jgi:hypothetical protein